MDYIILYFAILIVAAFFEGWCRAIEGGYLFEDMMLATAANVILPPLAIFLNAAAISKHYWKG